MRSLTGVFNALAAGAPALQEGGGRARAAVALVLCEEASDLSLLLIRRTRREGDLWSGHLAFPGGRVSAGDAGPRETAERETLEEVGLALRPQDYAGRLDDLSGRTDPILVSGFVYGVARPAVLVPNHEVERAFWVPLAGLADPGRHVQRDFSYREHSLALPAIRVLDDEDAPLLWGLSYRFLELLMAALGREIPGMPWHSHL